MMRHVSISLRVTIWFGCLFFAGWLLFGTAMWLNLKHTLTNERYQTLSRRTNRLQDLLNKSQNESAADRADDFADFANATGNGLSEVFYPNGKRVFPSPSPAAKNFPWPSLPSKEEEKFLHVRAGSQGYWVLIRPVTVHGQALYLLAGAPSAGNELVLQRFLAELMASVPLLLLSASFGGYVLSRKALRPVDRITTAAHSISIRNLSERLPVANTGDELQRLAETCNQMLARLETSVNQIKQFTADASHELRGPLSFTRTVAEVALRNPEIDPKSRHAFTDIVEEVSKASDVLSNLLTLARADAERFDLVLKPVDLAEVVRESYDHASPIAEEHKHSLSLSIKDEPNVTVLGDISSLRRLAWILLDNAIKYTPASGRIHLTLQTDGEQAIVTVADTGIGIPENDLACIFDRFYRADPSRSQVDGSGLGLSIAKWIADSHRAELKVFSRENEGTTFRLVFPLLR